MKQKHGFALLYGIAAVCEYAAFVLLVVGGEKWYAMVCLAAAVVFQITSMLFLLLSHFPARHAWYTTDQFEDGSRYEDCSYKDCPAHRYVGKSGTYRIL